MYTANSRAIIKKKSITDRLRNEIKWNHIKILN